MILAALDKAYDRLAVAGIPMVPLGFEQRSGRNTVLVTIASSGAVLHSTVADAAWSFLAPTIERTSGVTANLLFDKASYVLPGSIDSKGRGQKEHEDFLRRHRALPAALRADPGIAAFLAFLDAVDTSNSGWRGIFTDQVLAALVERKDIDLAKAEREGKKEELERACAMAAGEILPDDIWVAVRLDGEEEPICGHPSVTANAALVDEIMSLDAMPGLGNCIISGRQGVTIARQHPAFLGAKLVSFNDPVASAVEVKNAPAVNAPTDIRLAARAARAFETLAGDDDHRYAAGDYTYVYFATERPQEDSVGKAVRRLRPTRGVDAPIDAPQPDTVFASLRQAATPSRDDRPYYLFCLQAASKGRVNLVRYEETSEAEVARRILRHHEDIHMGRPERQPIPVPLWALALSSLSAGQLRAGKPAGKSRAKTVARREKELLDAVLFGHPYPSELAAAVLSAMCADSHRDSSPKSKDKRKGEGTPAVTARRVGLLRGWLNRRDRAMNEGRHQMSSELDPAETSAGYLCGRLLSILEYAQWASQTMRGGERSNTTMVQLHFESAMQMPAAVLPRLIAKAKKAWLAKLQKGDTDEYKGKADWIDQKIGEIVALMPEHAFPRILNLEEKGRFAIGYYTQKYSHSKDKPAQTAITTTETGEDDD